MKILGVLLLRTTNQMTIQQNSKTPGGTLKQVKDVVTKGAKPAEAAKGMAKKKKNFPHEETIEEGQEIVDEVVEEETEETVEEYDVDEDVNALLGGEELSEEFKEKAKTIFEAAINAKVAGIKEALESSMLKNSPKR